MSDREDIISIIIPVYNVEEYLGQCLSSIVSQSYSNLEIIIIDDGSTDSSPSICDTAAINDSRIKVIHKSNGGLSNARNVGISMATGKYLAFVDGDDYIYPKMMELLLFYLIQDNCDVECCNFTSTDVIQLNNNHVENNIFTNDEATSMLLDDNGYKCYAWNKLYRRELFYDVMYPEGKLFEDIQTTYKIFRKAKRIGYIQIPLYYYRLRDGSITRNCFGPRNRELIDAINYIVLESKNLSKDNYDRLVLGYMSYYLGHIKLGLKSHNDLSNEIHELTEFIKLHWHSIFKYKNISFKRKAQLIAFVCMNRVFCQIVIHRK